MDKSKYKDKKWRKVSIDEERRIKKTNEYQEFRELVADVMDGSPNTRKKYKETGKVPTRSYGIILVFEDKENFYYLMGEMRTTIEFADVIRNAPNPENIYDYLCSMTEQERDLLTKYDHSKLWDDLLMGLKGFESRKETVRKKYKKFLTIMPNLVSLTTTQTDLLPYGFPKGRTKKGDASGLASAVRELREEMKIDVGKIVLILEESIEEMYRGTDGHLYATTYFIVKANEKYEPPMTYLDTNVISEMALSDDFKNYIWLQIPKTSTERTTPLNARREKMLLGVHNKLCNN